MEEAFMRILIVSLFFPPRTAVASLRPYSWAKWWSRAGHDVTVLTPPKRRRPSDTVMPFEGFHVHELPSPILGRYFSSPVQGQKVFGSMGLMNRIQEKYGVFSACRFPDSADLWALGAIPWACKGQWDLVVSTGGPYSVHRIGLAVKRQRPKSKWIVDWRDLWTDNHIYPGLPLLRSYEKLLEKQFHRTADLITTVSEPLARVLRAKTKTRVEVIFNGFDPEDYITLSKEPFFGKDGPLRLVYTGTIYIGKRDPSPLFHAIRNLKNSQGLTPDKLKVVFVGNTADVRRLAAESGVQEFCEEFGLLPRTEALRAQRDADVLLFLEFEAPGVDGVLTGKIFEYLFAQKFILGVGVSERTSAGNLIVTSGHGIAVGRDVTKIQASLEKWLSDGIPAISTNSSVGIEKFSRKEQAMKILNCL